MMDYWTPDSTQSQPAGQGSDSGQSGIHAKIIPLLQEMHDVQQTIVLMLSDDERQAGGTFESWSFKDTLAHIVAWSDVMNMRLDMLARDELPINFENVDQINAEFYRERARLSWSAVLESSRKAYTGLVERIRRIPEADLIDPDRYAWLEGEPLWRRILNAAYVHPLIHLAYYYNQHGRKELGLKLQEDAAQKLLAFDRDPGWHSEVIYNLACQYAISGDTKTAIAKLRLALRIDSGLLEWSRQDPDFNAIRQDPAYQAIYTEFEA